MKTRGLFRLFFFSLLALSLIPLLPGRAMSGEPTEQVKETVDAVIKILNDRELEKPQKKEQRRAMISETVKKRFDFEEMAKRSLATHWKTRTPAEQKEFIKLYTDLLEDTYVRKVERYENEKVVYVGERVEDVYAVVKTRIVSQRETEIPVDYKIFRKGDKWEVYDIIVEGVSLVNNYRTQFGQIVRKDGYEELVKRIKNKTLKDTK